MASCVFCEIVAGRVGAEIVLNEEHCTAFLDGRPLFPGHTLVVPDRHVPTFEDLPDDLLGGLFDAARRVTAAVREATGAQGTFVAMNNTVSQSVPHLHVHVVPRTKGDGLRGFFWPRNDYENDAHRTAVAVAIRARLES
jgi:histidine triad (HIT) family protein